MEPNSCFSECAGRASITTRSPRRRIAARFRWADSKRDDGRQTAPPAIKWNGRRDCPALHARPIIARRRQGLQILAFQLDAFKTAPDKAAKAVRRLAIGSAADFTGDG